MNTEVVSLSEIDKITEVINSDDLVALPTETVYGLGARASSEEAVKKVFEVKERPQDNPLIVHCSSKEEAFSFGKGIPGYANELASFWPGPLTLVFDSKVNWPWVQVGHRTIAVRVPDKEYLRKVIEKTGPIAAPSANLSGKPSPTDFAHCLQDLNGKIPLIVDGGKCEKGIESTVVDCTGEKPVILRPGPITQEEINVIANLSNESDTASPGTKHTHYKPSAEVILVEDASKVEDLDSMIISPRVTKAKLDKFYNCLPELARELYSWFREADKEGVKKIYFEYIEETGLGLAIMNRVRKASS